MHSPLQKYFLVSFLAQWVEKTIFKVRFLSKKLY
jgi:hypothetical protein